MMFLYALSALSNTASGVSYVAQELSMGALSFLVKPSIQKVRTKFIKKKLYDFPCRGVRAWGFAPFQHPLVDAAGMSPVAEAIAFGCQKYVPMNDGNFVG